MLRCIIIDSTDKLKRYSVEELCKADMVIVPAGLIEEAQGKRRPYTEQLSKKAKAGKIPPAPTCESPTVVLAPRATSYLGAAARGVHMAPILYGAIHSFVHSFILVLTPYRTLFFAYSQPTLREKLLLLRERGSETWYAN